MSEIRARIRTVNPKEADCLVGDDDPSFGQQILDVSKAECESVVEPDGMTDDLRW